jgi:hypothetical protein
VTAPTLVPQREVQNAEKKAWCLNGCPRPKGFVGDPVTGVMAKMRLGAPMSQAAKPRVIEAIMLEKPTWSSWLPTTRRSANAVEHA